MREAGAEDWPGIWQVLEPTIRAGETYTYPRDLDEAGARTAWTGEPGVRVLVAVEGAAVVGTARYLPNHPGAGSHVANASFVVAPWAAGRGLGRLLGEEVLARARADGFVAMQFNAVVETNVRAVRLWESLGFTVLATVPRAFDHPRHGLVGLLVMHREL